MKLTEGKIKEAQEIIEAVMEECKFAILEFGGFAKTCSGYTGELDGMQQNDDLATLYINRLHELAGTQAPPF